MKTKKEYVRKFNREESKLAARIPGYQRVALTGNESLAQLDILGDRIMDHVTDQAGLVSWRGRLKKYDTVLNIRNRMKLVLLALRDITQMEQMTGKKMETNRDGTKIRTNKKGRMK